MGALPAKALLPAVEETHISLLFFVGDRVYKLRKPVRFDFLDFTRPSARALDCEREVELNRRLSPDVYLGVASLVEEGRDTAHFVVMRRLPADRSLESLVAQGSDVSEEVRLVARRMAAFHASAERSETIAAAGTATAIRERWEGHYAAIDPFLGGLIDPGDDSLARRLVGSYLGGRRSLFDERVSAGHVCDGHGDLQAADIFCLPDGPRILDCVEFDDRLRHVDTVYDIAFLAMDLERLGAPGAAGDFVTSYRAFSGETFPESLLRFYMAERAYIRALVACLRTAGRSEPGSSPASLHRLALDNLKRSQVRAVAVGGLPGTGKSTIASRLAPLLRATLLRTDEVRRELRGRPDDPGVTYGERAVAAVYEEVLRRTRVSLTRGTNVVIDATWSNAANREVLRRLADETSSELTELVCRCPAELADSRLRQRRLSGPVDSDATSEVRASMERRFAPWPEATGIDTAAPLAHSLSAARRALDGRARSSGAGSRRAS